MAGGSGVWGAPTRIVSRNPGINGILSGVKGSGDSNKHTLNAGGETLDVRNRREGEPGESIDVVVGSEKRTQDELDTLQSAGSDASEDVASAPTLLGPPGEVLAAPQAASDAGFDDTLHVDPQAMDSAVRAKDRRGAGSQRRGASSSGESRGAPVTPIPLSIVSADYYSFGVEFGRGGMGRIFEATDLRLNRPVAIKELLMQRGAASARFEREARITARLQHPAIVPVYEAGRWPSGEPFYAMKRVQGRSLQEVIAAARTLHERLQLLPNVIQVAEAIAYAHSRRVIHRDLKPDNVLVGEFGETVVIDWGVAKDLNADEPDTGPAPNLLDASQDLTVDGSVMGTPAYMPPEQADGQPVDERADVYALGAVLYHVLGGKPPYEGQSALETLEKVRQRDPTALSQLVDGVPPDLLAIVDKSLARSADDRYPSAQELAEDLKRFRGGQLVGAHRYSASEIFWRWVKRHRAVLGALLVAGVALLVFGLWSLGQIYRERDNAMAEKQRADQARDLAEEQKLVALEEMNRVTVHQARASLEQDPAMALAWLKRLAPKGGSFLAARSVAARAQAMVLPERIIVSPAGFFQQLALVPAGTGTVFGALSTQGGLFLYDEHDPLPKTWELAPAGAETRTLRFSTDGQRLLVWDEKQLEEFGLDAPASRRSLEREGLRRWVEATQRAATLRQGDELFAQLPPSSERPQTAEQPVLEGVSQYDVIDTAPNGQLVVARSTQVIRYWRNGKSGEFDAGSYIAEHGISADGRFLVAATSDELLVLDLDSGHQQRFDHGLGSVAGIAVHPVEPSVVAWGREPQLTVVEFETGRLTREPLRSPALGVHFSPSGKYRAVAEAQRVVVTDLSDGRYRELFGHTTGARALSISDDGRVLSAGFERSLRFWKLESAHQVPLPDGEFSGFIAAHSGRRLALVRATNVDQPGSEARAALGLWEHRASEAATPVEWLPGKYGTIQDVAWAPSDDRLVAVSEDGSLHLWALSASGPQHRLVGEHDGAARAVAFAGSQHVITRGEQRRLRVFDLGADGFVDLSPPALRRRQRNKGSGLSIDHGCAWISSDWFSVSADGSRVTASFPADPGGCEHEVHVWQTNDKSRHTLKGGMDHPVFSPAGDVVAAFGPPGKVALFQAGEWSRKEIALAIEQPGRALTFSPDGAWLAVAGFGEIALVPAAQPDSPDRMRVLTGHQHAVTALAFSPDSKRLVSADEGGEVRLWELDSNSSRALPHAGGADRISFLADGVLSLKAGRLAFDADDLPLSDESLFELFQTWPYQLGPAGVTTVRAWAPPK